LIEAIDFEPTWRQDPVPMSGAPFEALKAALPGAPEAPVRRRPRRDGARRRWSPDGDALRPLP
jgi:hypothetical protein